MEIPFVMKHTDGMKIFSLTSTWYRFNEIHEFGNKYCKGYKQLLPIIINKHCEWN